MMKIGNLEVSAGEFKRGPLGHIELPDGTKVNIPMLLMRGTTDGPTCAMTALVHGDEIVGTEVVRRLFWEEVKPDELRGTLVAFPAANPLAFHSGRYISPQDNCNLSVQDFFNGDALGSVTQRIAFMIGEVLKRADYVLDIHGSGPEPSICFVVSPDVYAKDKHVRDETIKMAKASGLTLTRFKAEAGLPGFFGKAVPAVGVSRGAVAHGIPAITIEFKDKGHLHKTVADTGVISIKNVLKAIGMLEGQPEKIPGEPSVQGWSNLWGFIRTKHGGLINILKSPGEKIRKGEVIARIYNVYGEEVEQAVMPVDGYFSTITGAWGGRYNAIGTGDILAIVWEECSPP